MEDFLLALKSYAYGIGWLVLCIGFSAVGFKVFDKLTPIDFRKEIEAGNMAFAVMVGAFLFGLTFGVLYFAANVS